MLMLALSASARMTPEQIAKLPPPASGPVDFTRDIRPILDASCIKCHGRGKAKGGFRLDTRATLLEGGDSGPGAVAGKSAESLVIELVSGADPDNIMPVKGSRLTDKQVSLLRAWIDQGLPWPAEVALGKLPLLNLRPHNPALPAETSASGPNPIDRLLLPYFAQHQTGAATPVSDSVFARRVYLDVIGLLPPPAELAAFEADTHPDKRARLVDKLLSDNRRYAEHWLGFWNDLLRNDYRGTGYIDGGRKQITGWLYTALAENKPFDRFVAELANPTDASEGYVKGIVWRGAVNSSQTPQMQAAQNISQVFLGVNLKCASCHDSFISDWTLADAYGMAAVYAEGPLEMFQCDKPTGKKMSAKFLFDGMGVISTNAPQAERRRQFAEILTSKENGRLTRTVVNRLWAKFMGRGLVEPVDEMDSASWQPDVLDWLAEDLAAHNFDLKRTMRLILTSRAYQRPAVSLDDQTHADYVFAGPAVRRLSAEQFRDALGSVTGVWFEEPSASIDPGAGESAATATTNLTPAPAQWIWSDAGAASKAPAETLYLRKNFTLEQVPDEAFVAATCDNSFTLYVNGKKVLSGNDFTRPSFVNLRSHLRAGENTFAVAASNHTPENKPPAANSPTRAEDANPAGFLLYARLRSGARVLDFGTDATWTWTRAKTSGWEKPGFTAADAKPVVALGDSGIAPWNLGPKLAGAISLALLHGEVRANLVAADPLATALGRPSREQVLTVRPSTATTLQAREMTNGETLTRLLQRAAEKVLAGKPATNRDLVTQLYARALGRAPSAKELQLSEDLLGQPLQKEHVEDLLWAMAMLPEFQLIY